MSVESNYLMLGLKGSGKTTFLAALWHYLESAEVDDSLRLPRLQPYRDYLNSIRSTWLSLGPANRTSLRASNTATLSLEHKKTGCQFDIVLPDLSGESFRLQWATRRATTSFSDFASKCSGVFLFVHPSSFQRTHAIKPLEADSNDPTTEGHEDPIPLSVTWTPDQSSTQVQLVDLLQILFGLREELHNLRLAVIVSAWDLINPALTPAGWLDRRLPLLSQFIRSNGDWMSAEIFGVSAQGGDLEKDRNKLLDATSPSMRCFAVSGNGSGSIPITAPLQFLLDINC